MGEFNKVTYLYGWCQKIIPLVYDDSLSYYEMFCKVREKLNEVITNTNMIPDMIKQEVQDFINSGQIEEMIEEILTGYLQRIVVNVVVPPQGITPAKGNGNDDTETFQQCIDYLAENGGGLLFVPDGDWMVKPLTIKNGVYIAGASVSTKITLIGGSSVGLISGTVTDCGVSRLTLSNNAAQQTVDKAVIDVTCNNITLDDLIVKNGYRGVTVSVNNGALIRNIRFDTLGYGGLYVNGSNADVSVSEITVKNVSLVSGQFGIDNHCDRAVYNHIVVYGPVPTGFSNNGASVTLKNAIIVDCETGIFNVGDDCDFTALVDGNTEIINDAGERTSYNFKGQNSQRKIGENVLNLGMAGPIMYRTPESLSDYFKTIPFQDFSGVPYNVLVATGATPELQEYVPPKEDFVNVKKFGAVGDATYYDINTRKFSKNADDYAAPTDDTVAINSAIAYALENDIHTIFFPDGDYYVPNWSYVLDTSKLRFVGENCSSLCSEGLSTGSFIKLVSTLSLAEYDYARPAISNLSLRGSYFDGTNTYNVTGLEYGDNDEFISPHISISNVTVSYFKNGILFGTGYKSILINPNIIACTIGINVFPGANVVPITVISPHIEVCDYGIFMEAVPYNRLNIYGGAVEYCRQFITSAAKVAAYGTRFESDLLAFKNPVSNTEQAGFSTSGLGSIDLYGCDILLLPNYEDNVQFWNPNTSKLSSYTGNFLYAGGTQDGNILLLNSEIATDQYTSGSFFTGKFLMINNVLKGGIATHDEAFNYANANKLVNGSYQFPMPANTGDVRYSSDKLQYYNGSAWVDVPTTPTT